MLNYKKLLFLLLLFTGVIAAQGGSNPIIRYEKLDSILNARGEIDTNAFQQSLDSLYEKTDSLQTEQDEDWDSSQVKQYVLTTPSGLPIDGLSIIIEQGSPNISVDSGWVEGIIDTNLLIYKDSSYINTHLNRDTILTDEVGDGGILRLSEPDENTRYWSPFYLAEGSNAFSGSAVADTISNAGITTNDLFVLTIKDATPITDDMLSYTVETGRLIVHRVAGTTSNLQYSYIRIY